MRRFLTTSLVALTLLICAGGIMPTAYAQTPVDNIPIPADAGTVPDLTGTALDPAAAKAAAGTQTDLPADPGSSGIMASVMQWIMSLFAWLVGVAAITLDNAVFYTVVTMGNYVSHIQAIGVTWRILRDIGNILLIFGFIAIGITTILNVDWYGGGKKMLPMLLVAAVFLNFSLFLSEAVIDTGNLFATQFYQQINGGKPAGAKDFTLDAISSEGISNAIMGQLGLSNIYSNGKVNSDIFKGNNSLVIGFMGIILFLITAFVMFSLAFILIARFVILIFLIILAPVGFAGLAVPQLKSTAGKWWSALFEQTITAPVLLLLLYIALAVITDAQFLAGFGVSGEGSAGYWTGFISKGGLGNFASMMVSFLVAMGLLLAVVIVSKKMSAVGAGHATSLAGKLTFGATAFGMRSTVGAGSRYLAQKVRTNKTMQKYGRTSRLLTSTLDRGTKGSFDIRGIAMAGGLKGLGINAGDAQKGGYEKRRADAIKGHEEYAKSVTKAIDERGPTKGEQAKMTEAEEAIKKAKVAKEEAERDKKAAEASLSPQIERHKAEVDRLEAEKKNDYYWNTDPKNEQRLQDAKQRLDASEGGLKSATDKLSEADVTLKNAIDHERDLGKAMGDRLKEDKLAAQEAYAETAKGFRSWVMYGPGGSVAARNIIRDSKKDPNKQLLDTLNKAIAAQEKADSNKGEDKGDSKPETPKA